MGTTPRDLLDFLEEAELSQYYSALSSDLKITSILQLKYVEEDDLVGIGMTKPEMRRLKRHYKKECPQGALGRLKKAILSKTGNDGLGRSLSPSPPENRANRSSSRLSSYIRPPSKQIIPADSIQVNKTLGEGEFGVVQQGVWTTETGEKVQVAIKCLSKERLQNGTTEFLKEAGIMQTIDHENIVRMFGVVLDKENTMMLVTELAPMRSLLECLKEQALRLDFPLPRLCDFAQQICAVNSPRILSLKRLYDKYPNKTMHAMKRLIYYIIFFHFLVPAKPGAVRKKRVTGKPTPPELERGQGRDRGRKDTWNLKSKIEKLRQIVTIHSHGDPTIRQNLAKCLNKRLASTTTPNMASFQGVSTSSSTCWTSGLDLLENLDLSLFSDSFQMAPSPNSNNSLQSVQNPSGLFDNELAGIKPDPATTAFDPKTDFTDEGGEPSLDKMGGDVLDMLTSFSDDVNDEYLNSFMDLTGFLQLEDSNFGKTEEECSAPEPEVVEEPVVTKKSKKRKLDEVGEESESFSASVDHDYVSKKPCASSSSTDAEVFVFEEPKTKVAPVEKYRERRVKNNIASRRSREIRKQKFANMEEEAERLVVENAKLHERIAEMEQMAKEMKATLISKLAGK